MSLHRRIALFLICVFVVGCPTRDLEDRPEETAPTGVARTGETAMTKENKEKPTITYDHEAKEREQEEVMNMLVDAERAKGSKPLVEAGGIPLKFDVPKPPANAVTAMTRCSSWVMGCFADETEKRGLTGPAVRSVLIECIRAAPRCQSEEPWKEARACCAARCIAFFEEALAAGKDAHAAWEEALFEKNCMPGVAELLKSKGG